MSSKDQLEAEKKVVALQTFRYPSASQLRSMKKEQMARLNYMASRMRTAILTWSKPANFDLEEEDEIDVWWWTGLQRELVSLIYS